MSLHSPRQECRWNVSSRPGRASAVCAAQARTQGRPILLAHTQDYARSRGRLLPPPTRVSSTRGSTAGVWFWRGHAQRPARRNPRQPDTAGEAIAARSKPTAARAAHSHAPWTLSRLPGRRGVPHGAEARRGSDAPRKMSPKEPLPILRPSRYLLPTRSSILFVADPTFPA